MIVLVLSSVVAAGELTSRQRAAVAFRGGNVLLEAVPGSGKTHVIVERCAALLADGVAASNVLLLTFSRRAVGELRARLSRRLATAALPEIRTFHGFAARLLAEAGTAGRSRRLLSEPAERALFADVIATTPLRSLPPGIGRSRLFRDAAAVRVAEIRRSPPHALARLNERAHSLPRLADLLALAVAQTAQRESLAVADYDDLVARAVTLALEPGSSVASALRSRYAHVLVDEFQDTDVQQLALLEQLGAEIFAVGDASQAIYGFRGAARDALTRAQSTLRMSVVALDESFRCPANICDLARSVWPWPTPFRSQLRTAGEITFRHAASHQDEAAFLGQAIAAEIAAGTSEADIAVLVRSAEPTARLVETELRARGISVARSGGDNVLDDLAVDAICAVLKVFANPTVAEHWVQLFAHPAFGIAPLALRLALQASPPHSVDDACRLAERLNTHARVTGKRFATALRSALAYWAADDPVRAARSFASEADVLGFLIAGDETAAQRSGRQIVRFLDALADVRDVRRGLGSDSSSAAVCASFFACSATWGVTSDAVDDAPGVRILTIHAAKGLEFDVVAIADAVDGRFPQAWRGDALLNSEELETARACGVDLGTRAQDHLAQERALWYVAVTRTKRKLLVTWAETELDGSPQRASRFIPLDARTAENQRAGFRGSLHYANATVPANRQLPTVARLGRPLGTTNVETWLTCRRKFYYGALLRIGSDDRGLKAKLGTLVHRSIQAFHATVTDFRDVAPGAYSAWTVQLRALARTIESSAEFAAFDSPLEAAAAMRVADRLLDRYARQLEASARSSDGGFEVVASEQRVSFTVEGVALSGSIDRIDRHSDGSLTLVDVKTGAFKKDKAMADAFIKLADAAAGGTLWVKPTPPGNPQVALYRHAKPQTGMLAYLYLDARPKFHEFADAAYADRLDIAKDADALAAIDAVLSETFFKPWTSGSVASLEPTRYARTCRHCEFDFVCPGYLEDDD